MFLKHVCETHCVCGEQCKRRKISVKSEAVLNIFSKHHVMSPLCQQHSHVSASD